MSYASRYLKQHTSSCPAAPSSTAVKQHSQQKKKMMMRRMQQEEEEEEEQQQQQGAVVGKMAHSVSCPPVLGGGVSVDAGSRKRNINVKRQSPSSLPIVATSKTEVTERLQSMMRAQEQIEALVHRQRQDERALVSLLQGLLARKANVSASSHTELQKALRDRNQALQLLNMVRVEGNTVVQRMHQHVVRQKKQIEALEQENAWLWASIGGIAHTKTEDGAAPAVSQSSIEVPDASGGGFVNTRATSNSRLLAVISALQADLRQEKQQRLEAEELSHKISLQHQRNVALLEERLQRVNNTNITEATVAARALRPNLSPTVQPEAPRNDGTLPFYSAASSSSSPPPHSPSSMHNMRVPAASFSPPTEGSVQQVVPSQALLNGLGGGPPSIGDEISSLIVSLTDCTSCGVR